jgi:hypothetical protein
MKEYRLSETITASGSINSEGLISSLSADDSTLLVTISLEEWQAATPEQQNQVLEKLGRAWVDLSKKIGLKEPELGRLRVVALDRFQKEHARWSARRGVQR